jgi:hypothetical protein
VYEMCVCVCERERERESARVQLLALTCVCVFGARYTRYQETPLEAVLSAEVAQESAPARKAAAALLSAEVATESMEAESM